MDFSSLGTLSKLIPAIEAAKTGDFSPMVEALQGFGVALTGTEIPLGEHGAVKAELARLAHAAFKSKNFVLQVEVEGRIVLVFVTEMPSRLLDGNSA